MMDFKEIQELIRLVQKSNLTEFKLEQGDFKLSLKTDRHEGKNTYTAAPSIMSVPAAMPAVVATPNYASAPAPKASNNEASSSNEAKASGSENAANDAKLIPVKSPMVGTFYRSPSPDKAPYVKIGDTIEKGTVVCIIEAMKLFNEIESEVAGKIVKMAAEDSSPVEYDQVLFWLEPK